MIPEVPIVSADRRRGPMARSSGRIGLVLGCMGLACLLMACSGTPPPPQPAPPPPPSPSNLVVTKLDLQTLRLTWTPPPGASSDGGASFDGYELEASVNGGPFARINDDLLPASLSSVLVTFSAHMPELLHLEFRLSCIVGGQVSGHPALASYTEPLRTPEVFAGPGPGGIDIGFSSDSQLATHFHV